MERRALEVLNARKRMFGRWDVTYRVHALNGRFQAVWSYTPQTARVKAKDADDAAQAVLNLTGISLLYSRGD